MMGVFALTVQIFVENLLDAFAHYEKAFGATLVSTAKGSSDELIHLELEILGQRMALAPYLPQGLIQGNITVLCIKFEERDALLRAYDALREGGKAQPLTAYPWSAAEAYVTDRFGVNWCIGM